MLRLTLILALLLFTASSYAATKQLKSYDELFSALKKGENVRAIMHYAKCELLPGEKEAKALADSGKQPEKEMGPEAIGGMNVFPFEQFAVGAAYNKKAYISFSENVLVGMRSTYVQNYVKVRVYDDNVVEITARYLDPKDLAVKMDEKFIGTINDGKNEGGIYFYQDD